MSEIKLTYFNVQARAETARLILAHAGVRYTDQRLTIEDFTAVKPKIPFGQLPTLKYNGELICQSMAIARLLANEYGLAGKNNLENAQADEIVDAVNDLFNARVALRKENDEDKKSSMTKKLLEETLPTGLVCTKSKNCKKCRNAEYEANYYVVRGLVMLPIFWTNVTQAQSHLLVPIRCTKLEEIIFKAQLESRLVERGGQYFVGNNLTWADLHIHFLVSVVRENHAQLLDGCPKIKNLVERIEELPNISKWLKSRPESDFDAVIKAF